MQNLGDKIEYAQFLHDYSEIQYTIGGSGHYSTEGQTEESNTVFFRIPPVKPDTVTPVIEVILK